MRRTALFAIGCALSLVVGVSSASADAGPHVDGATGTTPDTCAACHRAHTAEAPYLLKEEQDLLCFTCHGSSGAGSSVDVKNGVGYSMGSFAGALRGGGFAYALIDTNTVNAEREPTGNKRLIKAEIPALGAGEGQATTSTHSITETSEQAWGNGAIGSGYGTGVKLSCGSCHDPHGNGNYRILNGKPGESGATTEVNIADAATKVYTTNNYWQAWDVNQIDYRIKVSEWCSTCHTRYLAPGSGTGEPASYKTSSGDPTYNYRHGTKYLASSFEALTGTNKTKPNCVQCHVSHGSNASQGTNSQSVTWPNGTAAGADSRLLRLDNRGVCQTCHNK